MIEFIFTPQNFPFMLALTVMLFIAILEMIGTIMGASLSSIMEQFIPGSEMDFSTNSCRGNFPIFLEWASLHFKLQQIPLLIVLIIFLLLFGITGLLIQDFFISFYGFMLPTIAASTITLVATLPLTKVVAIGLSKILPQDETSAISIKSLIGKNAEITLGTTKKGYPTRGKAKDHFGKTHYFMLEPESVKDTFHKGDLVLLVRYDENHFYVSSPTTTTHLDNTLLKENIL